MQSTAIRRGQLLNTEELADGVITCLIKRDVKADSIYLLSCAHVLHNVKAPSSPVFGTQLFSHHGQIAVSTPLCGNLPNTEIANPSLFGLDSQLARLSSAYGSQGLGEVYDYKGIDRGPRGDANYHLVTPIGMFKLRFKDTKQAGVNPYPLQYGARHVVHETLLLFELVDSSTEFGYSGSPVIRRVADGHLLTGMHIAGAGIESYVIPAEHLFEPGSYRFASSHEHWQLASMSDFTQEVADTTPVQPPTPLPIHEAIVGNTPTSQQAPPSWLTPLLQPHAIYGSINWHLTSKGISIDQSPPLGTDGEMITVPRIWNDYRMSIMRWSDAYQVPAELIVATIATESGGDANALREEPGYVSDTLTPNQVSIGLMQTLIETAQRATGDKTLNRSKLKIPMLSVKAGTAYMRKQFLHTGFDPPKTCCAYNAGSIRRNNARNNRWKMFQHPQNTGRHADRFVAFFNDCMQFFSDLEPVALPQVSYARWLARTDLNTDPGIDTN